MSMTNNDEMALKARIEKALDDFTKGRACMHVPAQSTDVDMVLSDCLALLAERDADKKRIAAMSQAFLNLKLLADVYLHAYEEAKSSVAELEARTVSVKLPENTPLAEAPEHIWLQTAGVWPENGEFSELTWCSDNQHQDDTLYVRADLVAGIKLDVGE